MAIENLAEVQTYLEAQKGNAEVKTYMDSLKGVPSLEVFKGLANTNAEYKSFMDSERDKHSEKSLATWKTNNLDKIYQERFAKENPSADPRDVELNKIKAEFESMKNATVKEKLTNKTLKQFQELKLPNELVDFIVSDEESTQKNIAMLTKLFAAHDEAIKLEFAKGNSYTPPSGSKNPTATTKESFDKMGYAERVKLATEQPEIYKELAK